MTTQELLTNIHHFESILDEANVVLETTNHQGMLFSIVQLSLTTLAESLDNQLTPDK